MTDFMLPDVRLKAVSPRLMDNTGRSTSPLAGNMRTVSRLGDRWGVRVDYENLFGAERGRIESFVANQRGAANRILAVINRDYPTRGNFPANELFTNNNFAAGLSPWVPEASVSLSAADRVLRTTRLIVDGTASATAAPKSPALTLTQFIPYCVRFVARQGRGAASGLLITNDVAADGVTGDSSSASVFQTSQSQGWGLARGVRMPWTSGSYQFGLYYPGLTGALAGDYYDTTWSSCAQCFLVDNGPNLLKFSDTFASPWVDTNLSVTANAALAADGTTSAANLLDTSTNSLHTTQQASIAVPAAADDVMICGEFKAAAQGFVYLQVQEAAGPTNVTQYFNLSAGTLGTLTTGANWSSSRAFMVNLGNGWWYCCLISRKTSSATSVTALVGVAHADNTPNYAGAGTAAIAARRVTLSQSSFPQRQVQSASTPIAALGQSGNAIYVKGLPASSTGLLLPGDWIEINMEPKRVIAELNSDAAGLGYLVFSPPLRNSPADNDPVLVTSPMGRFVIKDQEAGWSSSPGPNANPFSTISLDLVEAPT